MTRTTAAARSFRRARSVAAVTLLLACGERVDSTANAGAPAGPGTVVPPADPTPAVSLAFAAALPAGSFDPLASAVIDDIAALYVVADWKNIPEGAVERLDLLMPSGALYASLELAIAETERGDLRFQVLDDGTRRLAFLLQVWGTPIEFYRMTGTWMATVTLVDGSATASASVTLS